MPEDFDPYRKWLGIPPADQPPDHYRLLGVGRFEDDGDTISNAADRQMAHVRTFQTGPHSAISQKLLNEISAARVCLLDTGRKAEYDARLKAKLAELEARQQAKLASQAPAPAAALTAAPPANAVTSPAAPPIDELVFKPSISTAAARRKRRSYDSPLFLLGGAGLLVAVLIIAVLYHRVGRLDQTATPRDGLASHMEKQPIGPVERDSKNSTAEPTAGPLRSQGRLDDGTATVQLPPGTVSPEGSGNNAAPTDPSTAKLEIIAATWGTGDRWQDITERLRSLVDEEGLLATAKGSLFDGVNDPAFGQTKQLHIRYKMAGKTSEREFNHEEFIFLDGRPADARKPAAKGLELLVARYGAGATWIDALPRLRRWKHGDRLAVRVSLVAVSDPAPNIPKALFLRYRTPDGEFVCHARDGEELVLDAQPSATAGNATDLLAAADPEQNSTGRKWRKEAGMLVAPDVEASALTIPSPLPNDYLLTAIIEGSPPPKDVCVMLPVGERRVQLVLDGAWRSVSGLQNVDGAVVGQNAASCRGTVLEPGQAAIVQCAVRPSGIYATCNGRVVVDWQGDPNRLSAPGETKPADQPEFIVSNLMSSWRISQLRVAPLLQKPPPTAAASGEVVDLLKLIDPAVDSVRGGWQMTDKGVLSPIAEGTALQVPFLPPDDYELRLVAERKAGNEALFVGLIVNGRQTTVAMDGWDGNVGGLHFLDGQTAERNATRFSGRVFSDERPKEIVCTVHSASVRVTVENRTLVDWHGDARRLSMEQRLAVPDELGLMLACWNTSFLISKLELRPLPPEKPADLARAAETTNPTGKSKATSKPPSLADLLDQPSADARRPAPDGKELKAAEKQVAEIYDSRWKAAKKPAERLALAREMYVDGVRTRTNPDMGYALLREAARHAAELGDAVTACDAIDQLGRDFQIDAQAEKPAICEEALKKAPAPDLVWGLVLRVSVLADGAFEMQDYEEAKKLISLLTLAGRRLHRADLTKYAERRSSLVRSRLDWHNRLEKALVRLNDAPDDTAANLTAGVGLCLLHGDWQRGLPHLVRSGDKRLVEIAKLETTANQDAAVRPALVDAWLAEAPNQSGGMRGEYELQAKYWLARGLPDAGPTDSAHKRALEKLAALPGISLARLKPGLDMAMYDGTDFQTFRARRVAEQVSHDFGHGPPHPSVSGDGFSIRWTGWIKPPLPGKYVIRTNSDDGCRLKINGNSLVDHWHRGAGEEHAEVELTDQLQPFSLEFNDTGATASVRVAWKLKDLCEFQPLPAEVLFYDPASGAGK